MKKFMMCKLPASAPSPHRRGTQGFTLIELMITVAIVGILAAVALPSYGIYIRKTRRADAMASLSQAQTIIERCYAANFSYAIPNPCTAPPATSASLKGFYTITATGTATTYTLTATATGSQAADKTCTQMTVDQANQMAAVDDASNPQPSCWNP